MSPVPPKKPLTDCTQPFSDVTQPEILPMFVLTELASLSNIFVMKLLFVSFTSNNVGNTLATVPLILRTNRLISRSTIVSGFLKPLRSGSPILVSCSFTPVTAPLNLAMRVSLMLASAP